MILVHFEQTLNPNVVLIFRDAVEESNRGSAPTCGEGLVRAILAVDGIKDVTADADLITVTRRDMADAWVALWPQIDRAMFASD